MRKRLPKMKREKRARFQNEQKLQQQTEPNQTDQKLHRQPETKMSEPEIANDTTRNASAQEPTSGSSHELSNESAHEQTSEAPPASPKASSRKQTPSNLDPSPNANKPSNSVNNTKSRPDDQPQPVEPVKPLSPKLEENKSYLSKLFAKSSDIIIREFQMVNGPQAIVMFVDGLVNSAHLEKMVLKPLMYGVGVSHLDENPPKSVHDLMEHFLAVGQAQPIKTLTHAIDEMLTGDSIFLVEGFDVAIKLSIKQWEHRSPSEPDTEAVVRGPREGFVESIRTNTALLRRRIRTPHFKLEGMKIGRVTKTDVVLGYIEGIVTDSVVDEVRRRLERIDMDGVIDSGYVEEFLEDSPFSPFPTIQPTERPDTVAASLLEGRVIVLVDGSPFVLIAPINLWGSLQSNEDYYERFMFSTLIRWLRYIFVIIALTLPSMYIAITTFHQEMLPTNLLLSIAAARESSPFPALVEALAMETTFEALREAGVRLPKTVGQAVSIVGALVIGQAAVQAGIVSAPMVIVVSLTGIANFTIPRYGFALSIRMLRFPLMILAGTFGLYGIVIGLIAIIIHVCSIRSLGVPYTTPIAPFSAANLRDTLLRVPWWAMNQRPRLFGYQNPVRIPPNQKPRPPQPDATGKRGDES